MRFLSFLILRSGKTPTALFRGVSFIVLRPKPYCQQQTQKWSSSLAVQAFPDWGARRPPYAVLVLPLMECKTRSTIPDEQDVNHTGAYLKCEKPKQPKNIKTKANNRSMSASPSLPSGTIKRIHVAHAEGV